jgi:multidrug efflux pump subunit AcrA (membrane-fusion protein)
LGADGNVTVSGTVDRIGRESDRQTHELLIDVLLADLPQRIAIGQRADAWIEVDRRQNVVRVPMSFIRHGIDGPYCWVDRGGRIARVAVTVGTFGTELAEVTSGLASGDVVLDAMDPGAELPVGRRWITGAL